jgi:CRISPR/Cas system CSM-associated protein Csm3 (group 7 of RAMP superfamily)
MNPYDFVRVDWQHPGERRPAPLHDRFSGINGRLEGTITALTPLFIGGKSANEPQPFLRDKHGRFIIPGSSLKGLFRNLVETVGGGSWWFFGRDGRWGHDTDYHANLPEAFKRSPSREQLDAACRMFGFLAGGQVIAGNVGFEDAICTESVPTRES